MIDMTCGGACCPPGSGSGSGDDVIDVLICGGEIVHLPGHRSVTFAGLDVGCTFFGCGTTAIDNAKYSLTYDKCFQADPCIGVNYRLGKLLPSEVLALHGLTLGVDCEGYDAGYTCSGFKYIGQVICGTPPNTATVDGYLAINLQFNLNPVPGNALVTLDWIIVSDSGLGPAAFLGGGITSSTAAISAACFPGDITFLCPSGTGTFGVPVSGDPTYAGKLEHATHTSADCCGDVTITVGG